jgi:DNA invertase Pin-like site-specific DNA recombinase
VTVRAYLRVSTTEQGTNGHGIDAQRTTIQAEVDRRGWDEVVWYEDPGWSGSSLDRPAVQRLLSDMRRADVVVVAKLDRLSRSLTDFAALMDRAKRKHWAFVALDLGVDTTTPTGRLVANVMASVAEWEREVISQRTREGMAAAKAKGILPGRRSALPGATRDRISTLRAEGYSLAKLAATLNEERVTTVTGKRWRGQSVHAALKTIARERAASAAATRADRLHPINVEQ